MKPLSLLLPLCLASAALAHQGVTNPAVMARMQGMSAINDAMKALSSMAKAEVMFDAETAARAKEQLVSETGAIPELFSALETDPKSEARTIIWDEPEAFADKAAEALVAAEALDVASLDTLRDGFTRIALSCKGCHDDYRLPD